MKRMTVRRRQQSGLPSSSAVPNGTDRVDDPTSLRIKPGRDACFAGRTRRNRTARFESRFLARSAKDRSTNAGAARERFVRGVDDDVDVELGDVTNDVLAIRVSRSGPDSFRRSPSIEFGRSSE